MWKTFQNKCWKHGESNCLLQQAIFSWRLKRIAKIRAVCFLVDWTLVWWVFGGLSVIAWFRFSFWIGLRGFAHIILPTSCKFAFHMLPLQCQEMFNLLRLSCAVVQMSKTYFSFPPELTETCEWVKQISLNSINNPPMLVLQAPLVLLDILSCDNAPKGSQLQL